MRAVQCKQRPNVAAVPPPPLCPAAAARSINYYYTKKRFNWTAVKFASVTALFGLVQLGATAACVLLFSRLLQAPDLALAALGVAAFALQNALKGLATREWMYYLSEWGVSDTTPCRGRCPLPLRGSGGQEGPKNRFFQGSV